MSEAFSWTAELRDPYREKLSGLSSHLPGQIHRATMSHHACDSLRLLAILLTVHPFARCTPKCILGTMALYLAFKALQEWLQLSSINSFGSMPPVLQAD